MKGELFIFGWKYPLLPPALLMLLRLLEYPWIYL